MLTRMLKLACAASMLFVIGACDGGALTGPEEDAPTSLNRTACMAGGEVAVRAGCADSQGEDGDSPQTTLERRPHMIVW